MSFEACEKRIAALKVWLHSCVEEEDWHGARDACTDIEVATARLKALREINETVNG